MITGLKNKTALITGASKGIGFATLKLFAENKVNIIACSKSKNQKFTKSLKDLSKKYRVKIDQFNFDISNYNSIKKFYDQITKQQLNIDFLVNNAGILQNSLFQMSKKNDLENMFNVNFFGQFYFTQLISKIMMKTKVEKSIVNIASTSAFDNNFGRSLYSSSKSALISMSSTISKELAPFNIRVNSIAPGLTKTEMMKNFTSEKNINDTINRTSLKRIADPNEIASVVIFLCSSLSSYITGQVIRVDGGMN